MESFIGADYSGLAAGCRTQCRSRSSVNSRVTASARAESASSAAWRKAWVGVCSSRLVRVLARNSMTSSGDLPAASRRRACSKVCSRMPSACRRSARMAGPASCARDSAQKPRHFLVDEQPGAARRELALLTILIDQLLQVVDGEQVHVFQLGHRRVDVARHGQIDHENGPPSSCAYRIFSRLLGDERHQTRGAGNDDVGLSQLLVEIVEARLHGL